MLAESVSCLFWVPIDVIKERQQIQSTRLSALSIIRAQGLSGIYRGYFATLGSFGPFSAFYFLFYEKLKSGMRHLTGVEPDAALPFWAFLASGATAGSLASFITNPLDMAKLRLQVQRGAEASAAKAGTTAGPNVSFNYRGFLHGLSQIYRIEGFPGLWRGAGARMAFHAPMTALSISLFEECKLFYGRLLEE